LLTTKTKMETIKHSRSIATKRHDNIKDEFDNNNNNNNMNNENNEMWKPRLSKKAHRKQKKEHVNLLQKKKKMHKQQIFCL